MPNDNSLTIIVKLQDEASAAIKSMIDGVSSALGGMQASMQGTSVASEEAGQQVDALAADLKSFMDQEEAAAKAAEDLATAEKDATSSRQGASSSWGDLAKGVAMGLGMYNLAIQAIQEFKQTIEDSVGAAMQESAILAQVAVDVKNAGESYAQYGPQIQAVAQQNIALGFNYNDTMLSLGKLMLATGSYSDALKLNQLAMDLSRAKGIDLNTASIALQQIMAGNLRALKQYGISLDSSATSADALNTLHQKLQGSSEAFAETSAGSGAKVAAEWNDLEIQFGEDLMPTVQKLFDTFETNLPEIEGLFEEVALAVNTVVTVSGWYSDGLDHFVRGPLRMFGSSVGNIINQLQGLPAEATDINTMFDSSTSKTLDLAASNEKLKKSMDDSKINFDDIINHIQAANNAMMGHSDAIVKLSDEYNKMQSTGTTDLADLDDSFKTKMDSINSSIASTQQKIADLTSSYTNSQQDATTKVAEQVVASEKKISDIKTQLAAASTDAEKKKLNDELQAEQMNYDSSYSFRQAHQQDILKAESRAGETSLEIAIGDYQDKAKADADAYKQKLTGLQQELKDKQTEADQERTLYFQKVLDINKILDTGQSYFEKLSAERQDVTTKEVEAEVKEFQKLATTLGSVKGANSSSLGTVSIPSSVGTVSHAPTTTASHATATSVAAAPTIVNNFHFPGVVAGDDGIKKIVNQAVSTINRQNTLSQFAGVRA